MDANGNLFIGYSAELRWNRIRIHFTNGFEYFDDSGLNEQKTLKYFPRPDMNSEHLTWTLPTWNIRASWDRIDPRILSELLHNDYGFIQWNCHFPRAQSVISISGKESIRGLGYAEKLELTIKPWNLPFHELHWGRYLSENDTIIWIAWFGRENFSILYHNGKPFSDAIIAENEVQFNQGLNRLAFNDTIDLRKGSLKDTALSHLTKITKLFPKQIIRTFENKWRSKGTFKIGGKALSKGWVIHEVVEWK